MYVCMYVYIRIIICIELTSYSSSLHNYTCVCYCIHSHIIIILYTMLFTLNITIIITHTEIKWIENSSICCYNPITNNDLSFYSIYIRTYIHYVYNTHSIKIILIYFTCNHLVKDMIISLIGWLEYHTGQLQEVVLDDAATDLEAVVETDLDELAESRTVVIAHCSCIAWR